MKNVSHRVRTLLPPDMQPANERDALLKTFVTLIQ